MLSGPTTVVFSAPKGLTTTATFNATGAYVLRLTATDGTCTATNDVSINVAPESAQTAFYVDPTFTGTGDGSAQAPWRAFEDGNPDQATQWSAINGALAAGPVIIYFSARQATTDVAEEILGSVSVNRTDKSSNRLTLDGMSKYNTNDANPSWADNGSSRMRIRMSSGCCFSIGWDGEGKQDYVTLRGFEVTGSGARITWGGSYSVLEYIWSHDVTHLGATVQFGGAVSDYPACRDLGKSHDITVRNIRVERSIGEGIYIAGTYVLPSDGGCPSYGNTHSDILIEGNTIIDPGSNGEEGDGMDLKAGLMNVTVRNNVITKTHNAFEGGAITSSGVFPPAKTNYLIEGNRLYAVEGGMALGLQNGTIIRNNLVYNCTGGTNTGIYVEGDATYPNTNMEIYNNTVYGCAAGVGLAATNSARLRNNLLFGGAYPIAGYDSTGVDSDYNLMTPTGSQFPEGTNSIILTATTGIVVDPSAGDFHLSPGSPAKSKGTDLSQSGFQTDIEGTARPQGTWSIGAYESR